MYSIVQCIFTFILVFVSQQKGDFYFHFSIQNAIFYCLPGHARGHRDTKNFKIELVRARYIRGPEMLLRLEGIQGSPTTR